MRLNQAGNDEEKHSPFSLFGPPASTHLGVPTWRRRARKEGHFGVATWGKQWRPPFKTAYENQSKERGRHVIYFAHYLYDPPLVWEPFLLSVVLAAAGPRSRPRRFSERSRVMSKSGRHSPHDPGDAQVRARPGVIPRRSTENLTKSAVYDNQCKMIIAYHCRHEFALKVVIIPRPPSVPPQHPPTPPPPGLAA